MSLPDSSNISTSCTTSTTTSTTQATTSSSSFSVSSSVQHSTISFSTPLQTINSFFPITKPTSKPNQPHKVKSSLLKRLRPQPLNRSTSSTDLSLNSSSTFFDHNNSLSLPYLRTHSPLPPSTTVISSITTSSSTTISTSSIFPSSITTPSIVASLSSQTTIPKELSESSVIDEHCVLTSETDKQISVCVNSLSNDLTNAKIL